MKKCQINLTPTHIRQCDKLAEQRKVSRSLVVREFVDAGLKRIAVRERVAELEQRKRAKK